MLKPTLCAAALALLPLAAAAESPPTDKEPVITDYSIDGHVKLLTDRRTRGISETFRRPAAEFHLEAAHASGLVGLVEAATLSDKVYANSSGYTALAAGGYRWGNHEGWHFGLGLAHEWFPGAHFEAPTTIDFAIDPDSGQPFPVPGGVRDFKFDTSYAVVEFAYGALEGRYLSVLSRDFRGANTGSVCGTLLTLRADPTGGLDCFARGDHGSRGTHLVDLDYTLKIDGRTSLVLHGGYQKVRHFSEADSWDWRVALKHSRWGLDWTLEALGAHMKASELGLAFDSAGRSKRMEAPGVVLTVAYPFSF